MCWSCPKQTIISSPMMNYITQHASWSCVLSSIVFELECFLYWLLVFYLSFLYWLLVYFLSLTKFNSLSFYGFQCLKRKLKVAVVGVPKTIDNDILLMDKTFGFDTAVEEAQRAINSAYIEVFVVSNSKVVFIAFTFNWKCARF